MFDFRLYNNKKQQMLRWPARSALKQWHQHNAIYIDAELAVLIQFATAQWETALIFRKLQFKKRKRAKEYLIQK